MLRFIILLGILILALSYFGISIRHIMESPTGADNLDFVWNLIMDGWNTVVAWLTGVVDSVKHTFS